MSGINVLYYMPIATFSIVLAASIFDLRATMAAIRSDDRSSRRRR